MARLVLAIVFIVSCTTADTPADDTDMPVANDTAANAGVASPESVLREALQELVSGRRKPVADHTWFSAATSQIINSVSLNDAGQAVIDFHDLVPVIPNASSSAGSTLLLEELNAAVFSVPEVQTVEYRMVGSCERFWNWLQYDCQTVQRPPTAP